MEQDSDINNLITFALADSMSISRAKREEIEKYYERSVIARLAEIIASCDEPLEAWTKSKSLQDAASMVEPGLRSKYPELTDGSIRLLLSHAAFSWK